MGPISSKQGSGALSANPPFPSLPSALVTATVLGYFAHEDLVKVLLLKLNHNSQEYFINQTKLLRDFLVTWRPDTLVLDFGNEYLDWTSIYPIPKQFD